MPNDSAGARRASKKRYSYGLATKVEAREIVGSFISFHHYPLCAGQAFELRSSAPYGSSKRHDNMP